MIKEAGILYAPDFVINAGGLINVSHELDTYVKERAIRDIERIYDRLKEIYSIAKEQDITTFQAAKVYAKQRMAIIGAVRANYIPR
jgi:leucine dehydrogenase